jgi:hypothetical protein
MNSNIRRWQISIATFFVISLLIASADALDATDYTRMHNLSQKTIQLQRDILSANQGARGDAVDCFGQLYTNLEQVSLRIGFLEQMVSIASLMVDKSDEQTVLGAFKIEADHFLKQIELNRKGINLTAGYCSRGNVVAVKAQEILRLYDEASSILRSMLGLK